VLRKKQIALSLVHQNAQWLRGLQKLQKRNLLLQEQAHAVQAKVKQNQLLQAMLQDVAK
jgi:hypothetical protein